MYSSFNFFSESFFEDVDSFDSDDELDLEPRRDEHDVTITEKVVQNIKENIPKI